MVSGGAEVRDQGRGDDSGHMEKIIWSSECRFMADA